MPIQNVTINNVSMDYFLRGVEAAKPQGAQAEQAPVQDDANIQDMQPSQRAGRMISQLDVLLMKAAQASTKSLDGKTVKKTFQKLVDDGALSRDSLKLLAKSADTAAKTLKALDKFTGRQLAEAFDEHGQFNPTATKAGKALAAAIKAQQDLSDLFAQLSKSLDMLSRHDNEMRNANPQYRGVDTALRNEVDECRLLCDRRATEINHLAFQMKDFAVHLAANGQNSDPNVVAILKTKVNELLPRQALAMHGTADALANVNENVSQRLRPLAEKIDAFKRNPSGTISSREFHTLRSDIATMKAALQDIRKNGIEVNGGRMMVSKDIIQALEKEVAQAEELFKTARKDVARTILSNYVETTRSLFSIDDAEERQQTNTDDDKYNMLVKRDNLLDEMENFVNGVLDPSKKSADIKALEQNLVQKTKELKNAAEKVPLAPGSAGGNFNNLINHLRGCIPVLVGLLEVTNRLLSDDNFFTGAEAMGVFNGTISASSIIEARARGLEDGDVDPANEDMNIVSEKKLGSGAAGSVYELKRSDGTSVVFKGETESRTGLTHIAAGSGNSYSLSQQTVNLNIAAKKGAQALGMGDMLVSYSAGTHNGVFGFYMDKAKGITGKAFANGKSSSAPDAGLSPKEIKKLAPGQRLQIKADMMREFNRMQWLDLLTGQADRHFENYFVHVDRETHKVTLKGIDNDAGYSQYRTGAVKFTLDKDHAILFKSRLRLLAQKIDSRHVEREYQHLLSDSGIVSKEDGTIEVDASKLNNKVIGHAISELLGVQTLVIPDKIDRETYNALMALKPGPQRDAYLAALRPRLSTASYNAAVNRLNDLIAHAEKLANEGKVIEKEGWLDVQEVPRPKGKVVALKENGDEKRLGGEIAHDIHTLFTPSIFARDGISKIFD